MSNLHRTDRANAHCAAQETASNSLDKTMSAGEMQKGISLLKEGDSTPVSAADFAIQGLVSEALQKSFPHDRFMGEAAARSPPSCRSRCCVLRCRHRTAGGRLTAPPPSPRTKWTRRVPHPVLIGHTPYKSVPGTGCQRGLEPRL
jgi:3'-phosphoadenosine 5'-phosphosulfate (PAPS) 3'-phosphatase